MRARYLRQALARWQTVDPMWPTELSPLRTTVYSEEYKYALRDELTMIERQCVADYMIQLKERCEFDDRDIGFWRPGEGGK